MVIKRMAVGNKDEAFLEERFIEGLNIISSDDNNKGKTIVIQSMMFALGNEPTFPTSFEYKKYYHYVEFEENGIYYYLCRFNNNFVLKHASNLLIFDSVSELKQYWTKQIFKLPKIVKNQIARIVDPVLFLQLFFVGQDKKNTSNIFHSGYYNKQDYLNMLFDICNISGVELNEEEITKIKTNIKNLKDERSILLKQYQILKTMKAPISYLSSTNDRTSFGKKIEEMEKIQSKISELKKVRNTIANRKAKWETTLKELHSLNRTIECGQLCCMDCGSKNISFSTSKKNGYAFDVSSAEMRKEITTSIKEKIIGYNEEIEKCTIQIYDSQDELKSIMNEQDVSLESIVAYKQEIFTAADAEIKIKDIDRELDILQSKLFESSRLSHSKKEKQTNLISELVEELNVTYQKIDTTSNLYFEDIFTKRDEVCSGSEGTVFYLSKILALRTVLNHMYPIIIDSFRAEDLSTMKEEIVIDLYGKIPNQVVLTTTLKLPELGKYDKMKNINHIDYMRHTPSKILSKKYVQNFLHLMDNISLKI